MSAPLTTQTGNLPTSGDALTKYREQERRRGVNLGFGPVPPGQLWERVAEREPAYSIRLHCIMQRADGGRGPRVIDSWGGIAYGAVIRAGQRVR